MSASAAPSREPSCRAKTPARRSGPVLASLCLFAILTCGACLALHYRHDIAASLEAVSLTAVRYKTVGMLSVP
jgi:hypothetical protein